MSPMATMRGALGNRKEVSSIAYVGFGGVPDTAGSAGLGCAAGTPCGSALLHATAVTRRAQKKWAARGTSATREGHLRGSESGRGHGRDEPQVVGDAVDALEHRIQGRGNRDLADG